MAEKAKKKKVKKAHDGVITAQHIQQAQQGIMELGLPKIYAAVEIIEPELTGFITAVAEHLAAVAMFEGGMSRGLALQLKQRIVALGLNVFEAQHNAVYAYYKDLIDKTPVAVLDAEPFPAPPKETDEGDACGQPK